MGQRGETTPQVSVVMSVFNGEDELARTVESILNQSFSDFEFIIVDDGSTDGTNVLLQELADRDSRIVVVRQGNKGLTRALINGCARARGELIARQDVGDRSLTNRIEKQVAYLEEHPEVVAVGTGCKRVGPNGEFLGETLRDSSPEEITRQLIEEGAGLSHAVSMFRREVYQRVGGYRPEFAFAQDSDLWYRLSQVGMLAEIPEVLFEWSIDTDGISASKRLIQNELSELARASYRQRVCGGDDTDIIKRAALLSGNARTKSSEATRRASRASAEFFIGSQLFLLGDRRCRHYLLRALRFRPFWIRAWVKVFLSYVKKPAS